MYKELLFISDHSFWPQIRLRMHLRASTYDPLASGLTSFYQRYIDSLILLQANGYLSPRYHLQLFPANKKAKKNPTYPTYFLCMVIGNKHFYFRPKRFRSKDKHWRSHTHRPTATILNANLINMRKEELKFTLTNISTRPLAPASEFLKKRAFGQLSTF